MSLFHPNHRGGRAFTLIECLVVLAIIGILIALLIPAVQSARSASRRTTCQNNLHQLGIGVAAYTAASGCLPPGQNFRLASLFVSILPYIEQRPLYDAMNFNADPFEIVLGITAQGRLSIATFLCPADPMPDAEPGSAWTSYAGSRGTGVQRYGENGAFSFTPPSTIVDPAEFTDGMSQTAMISEWIMGTGPSKDRDPLRGIFGTPERLDKPEEFDRFAALCRDLDPATARVSVKCKGSNWLHGEFGMTLYNHTLGPNQHTCLNGTGYQVGAWTAGSRHPGTVNTLFADGSTRPVRHSVALAVWRALGSRNGQEVVYTGDDL